MASRRTTSAHWRNFSAWSRAFSAAWSRFMTAGLVLSSNSVWEALIVETEEPASLKVSSIPPNCQANFKSLHHKLQNSAYNHYNTAKFYIPQMKMYSLSSGHHFDLADVCLPEGKQVCPPKFVCQRAWSETLTFLYPQQSWPDKKIFVNADTRKAWKGWKAKKWSRLAWGRGGGFWCMPLLESHLGVPQAAINTKSTCSWVIMISSMQELPAKFVSAVRELEVCTCEEAEEPFSPPSRGDKPGGE